MSSFKKNITCSLRSPALVFKLVAIYIGLNFFTGLSVIQAQNPVDILDADLIEGGTVNGEKVRKILGNVFLKSTEQNLEMYCDSAYQFIGSSEIRAFGNIQINTENEKIWADSLVYFTDVDFSQLRGRVIIEADSTTIFGNSVDYRFSTKIAHFIDQVRLEDQNGILSANSGFYYREADSAVFRGQVQLRDSTQYIEGDSLFSNREKKYYEIYGNIFARDGENNSTLKGDYLEADSTGRRLLKGNAWLKNVKKDTAQNTGPDSLEQESTGITNSFRPDSLSFQSDTTNTTVSIPQTDSVIEIKTDTTLVGGKQITHVVNTAETLFSIAQIYNVTVQNIKDWNNLNSNDLQAGQTLVVNLPSNTIEIIHTVQPRETLFSISNQYNVSISEIKSWNNLDEGLINVNQELKIYADQKKPETVPGYIVKKGDNLFKIAHEHDMTVEELKRMNNLTTNTISAGQQLRVENPADSTSFGNTPLPVKPDAPIEPDPVPTVSDTSSATEADTTHIRANKILSVENRTSTDTSAIINAYEDVRIWSRKFSAIADTSRYDDSSETFELWSNSKAWHKLVQLSGPYIKVILESGDIDQLQSYPKPFTVQEDTSIDRLNQIKGDTLNAYFQEGNLSEIHVFGGSHLLRFTKDDQDQPDGAIDLTAPSTRIFFEDGELVELKSEGTIDGSYLPESEQTAQRQLDGFIWTPELRPQRPEQKMKRRFPPIPEERPFELPRRYIEYTRNTPE